MRKTAVFAGYDRHIIQKILIKNGVETYPTNSNKLSVNYDYFKELTIGSSYFLGLWVADGSVSIAKNSNAYFNLSLKKDDVYILELLKNDLKSDHKIIHTRDQRKIAIGDNRLLLNIAKWGIEWEDKTHRLTDCAHLFNELDRANTTHHFIRGFFDGDGCVSIPKRRYNTAVSFSGTEAFISKIRDIINKRCGTTGHFRPDRPYRNVDGFYYMLVYTGIPVSIKILSWLYQDKGEYYLKRKHDIYSRMVA